MTNLHFDDVGRFLFVIFIFKVEPRFGGVDSFIEAMSKGCATYYSYSISVLALRTSGLHIEGGGYKDSFLFIHINNNKIHSNSALMSGSPPSTTSSFLNNG